MLEMLAALSLVGVFLIVAGTLVNQVFTIQREAARMEWATSRIDHVLREVRKDVWAAGAIERSDDQSFTMEIPGPSPRRVTWRFESDPSDNLPHRGWLIRESEASSESAAPASDAAERFEVPLTVEFTSAEGAGLTLEIGGQQVWLASQVMAGRMQEARR